MQAGYILALITSLFYSLYVIPWKFSKASAMVYTLFLGIGFALFSVGFYLTSGMVGGFENLMRPIYALSALTGAIWAVGFVFFAKAVDAMGIASATQWRTLQGPFAAILGLIFLGEHAQVNLIYVTGAMVAIFSAALIFTKRGRGEAIRGKGTGFAFAAAGLFSLIPPLQRYTLTNGGSTMGQQVYFAVFVLIAMLMMVWWREKKLVVLKEFRLRDNFLGFVAGAILFLRVVIEQNAYARAPVSIAFTIMQFNVVWTILIGVFWFREMEFRRYWRRICGGIGLAMVGIVMLLFA